MAKCIKLLKEMFLDTTGIVHKKKRLDELLTDHLILLWENADPGEMSNGYSIALKDDDYDLLLCLFATNVSSGNGCLSAIALKGKDIRLMSCDSTGAVAYRNLEYINGKKYTASDGTQAGSVQARRNVPLAIYGIKLFS